MRVTGEFTPAGPPGGCSSGPFCLVFARPILGPQRQGQDGGDQYESGNLCAAVALHDEQERRRAVRRSHAGRRRLRGCPRRRPMIYESHGASFRPGKPGDLLVAIARELRFRGLEIREYSHGTELVEIAVTDPNNSHRGRVTVGYEGFFTWEYNGDVETWDGAMALSELATGLLAGDLPAPRKQADSDTAG